jgi:hypothetical protein
MEHRGSQLFSQPTTCPCTEMNPLNILLSYSFKKHFNFSVIF